MAALPTAQVEDTNTDTPALRWLPDLGIERLIAYVVLLISVCFSAFYLVPEATIKVQPLNDNVLHIEAARQAAQSLSAGRDPTDSWFAQIGLGYPLFHHYQHLEYIPVAAVNVLTRNAISIPALIHWSTVLLLSLFPLSMFWAMRQIGFGHLAAGFSGMAAPLLATHALYGFDFASYVWRGYGLYTQVWGMFLLPLALAFGYRLLREGRGYFLATLFLVTTLLCHTVYGYMALLALAAVALLLMFDRTVESAGSRMWAIVRRLVLLFGFTALAGSYFLVPFMLDGTYMNRSVWELQTKYNSYGASWVLTNLGKGDLFDYGRLPVLTILAGIGLIVCVVRWREPLYRLPVALFVLWLALYFGRPTWGSLLDVLPLSSEMQFHRLIGGVHLAGLLLIGIALAAPWPWLLRQPKIWPAVCVGILCAGILFPAYRERANYLTGNAELMRQTQSAFTEDQTDLNALTSTLRSLPPGRVYAGFAGGWGNSYRVGSVPMYTYLQNEGFDMVGYLYHALSLNSDVEVWFDETRQYEYNLYNVRYVVAPVGRTFPSFVKPVAMFGSNELYQVQTTGYFDLVQTTVALVGNKSQLYPPATSWLKGAEPGLKQEPQVVLSGRAAVGSVTLPLATSAAIVASASKPVNTPKGAILSETVGASGSYAATVRADEATTVMVKVTYHPGWRITVDGAPVTPIMLMPSFIGIPVTAGTHHIQLTYAPSSLRLWLQILGILTLAGTVVVDRRRKDVNRGIDWLENRSPFVSISSWYDERLTMWKGSSFAAALSRHLPYLGLVAGLSVLAGLPLLQLKAMMGHDAAEYIPRSEEFYKVLSSGTFLPRWAPDLSAGRGEPFFAFNPPLIYYATAFFHWIGFSFIGAEDLASFVLLVLAAFGMYLLANSFFGPQGGLVASAAYLFAPYFLVALYVRHSLTDFAAFAFLPFAFWGIFRYAERGRFHQLLVGSSGLALLILSSNPVALMVAPFLGLLVAVPAYMSKRLSMLVRGALALMLGLGLSAFFWIPAFTQRHDVHVARLLTGVFNYHINVVYLLQLIYSPWGYGGSVAGPYDGMSFQIGPVQLLLMVAALTLFVRIRVASPRASWMVAVMAATALGAAFLTTTLALVIWDHLTLLQYMAFPWRFLSLVAFGTAFLAGFPLLLLKVQRWLATAVTVALLFAVLLFGLPHAKPAYFLNYTDADFSPSVILSKDLAVTSEREYQPIWVEQGPTIPSTTPLSFLSGRGQLENVSDSTATNQKYELQIAQLALVRAHTSYFPGWTLRVDGSNQQIHYDRVTGEIEFSLNPGTHKIQLVLKPTAVEVQSAIISIIALVLLLLIGLTSRAGLNERLGRVDERWRLSNAGESTAKPTTSPMPKPLAVRNVAERAANDLECAVAPAQITSAIADVVPETVLPSPVKPDAPVDLTERLVATPTQPAPNIEGTSAPTKCWRPVSLSVKVGIYLLFVSVYLVTGPGHFYTTDHVAVYLTTQSMVEHHNLVIAPIARSVVGRGGKSYGRYGLLQSVASIPLYLVGKAVNSVADPQMRSLLAGPNLQEWGGTVPIFFVSLFNAFVTPFTCLLVFLFALRLGFNYRVAVGTMFLFGFSTLTWTYARDYFQHPLETLLLFLTAYLLFIHRDRLTARDTLNAGIPLGFAVLTRLNIAVVIPVFAIYVFLIASDEDVASAGHENESPVLAHRIVSRLKRPISGVALEDLPSVNAVRVTAAFLAWPILSVLFYLGLNYYRFDTIRDPAFGNILEGSLDIFVGLYGNLLSPGRSIFLFSPPLILALLVFRQFYRRFRYEALLVAGIAVCYIVLYSIPLDWDGGWSWGPRYLLAIVPFLMLPLGYFFTNRARVALAVAFGILGAGIQLLGIIINYSYVYWDWTYMKLVPGNAFLFVPGISPIPTNFHDLMAGKNVDMWIVWVYHQSGLMAVLGIAGIAVSLFMAGLFFLIDGVPHVSENVDDAEIIQADYANE